MQTGSDKVQATPAKSEKTLGIEYAASAGRRRRERSRNRALTIGIIVVLVVLVFFSLGFRDSYKDYIGLGNMLSSLPGVFKGLWANITNTATTVFSENLLEAYPYHRSIWVMFLLLLLTIMCAILLSLAGVLFQNTFRNPIAGPNMLGVSSGVQLGTLIMVMVYEGLAPNLTAIRYAICFGCAVGVLVCVMGISKLISGKRAFNVANVIVVGALFSSLIGTIVSYMSDSLTDELQETLYTMHEGLNMDLSWFTFAFVGVVMLITCIPLIACRFSFNSLMYSDQEMSLFGFNPSALRFLALAMGTVMMITAQVVIGNISMISLVVPFIARAVFGGDFRRQVLGSIAISSVLLVLAQDLGIMLTPYLGVMDVPLSMMVNIVALPAFVYLICKQQRGWE